MENILKGTPFWNSKRKFVSFNAIWHDYVAVESDLFFVCCVNWNIFGKKRPTLILKFLKDGNYVIIIIPLFFKDWINTISIVKDEKD